MTVDSIEGLNISTSSVRSRDPRDPDEIDLRQLIEVLFSWWREILVVVAVAAGVGAVMGFVLQATTPLEYKTSADVIMARVVSSVNLVDSFRTTTEDVTGEATHASARRETLVNLVKSGAIADAVIVELGNMLSEGERNPATLIQLVEAEAPLGSDGRTISDLIRISVTADSPDKARAIADAWAQHYVAHINSVYNQVPNEIFQSVEEELQEAEAEYQRAQKELESFIATNQIDELQIQIDKRVALRTNYQEAEKALLASVVEQDRAARMRLFTDLVETQTEALYQVFNSQVDERANDLSQLYQARDLSQRQLVQAENLRHQIEEGSETATVGTRLALQLLKTQVYASIEGSSLPAGLTLDLGTSLNDDGFAPIEDVAALIDTLEQYIAEIGGEIDVLSEQLLAGEGYDFVDSYVPGNLAISTPATTQTITAGEEDPLATAIYARYLDLFRVGELARFGESGLSAEGETEISMVISGLIDETQALQAALAGEQSSQLLLTQRRDQTWDTYNTLSNKVVEFRLARTAGNTEVRFGSPAIAPNNPVPGTSLLLLVAGAGMLGFIFAVAMVTIGHLMSWRPWLSLGSAYGVKS